MSKLPEQIRATLDRSVTKLVSIRDIIAAGPSSQGIQLLDRQKDAPIRRVLDGNPGDAASRYCFCEAR